MEPAGPPLQADAMLSTAGCRLRESYCQLKDARIWLRNQLHTEESTVETQDFQRRISESSRSSSTCSPQSRAASEGPDEQSGGAERGHKSNDENQPSPSASVKTFLCKELEGLRGELKAEQTKAKQVLIERDTFASEAAEALAEISVLHASREHARDDCLAEISELHASREHTREDCMERGACALQFAQEAEAFQAELNFVCADRDTYSTKAEAMVAEVADLRTRLANTRYECEASNLMAANSVATIVRLRMETDSLVAECHAGHEEPSKSVMKTDSLQRDTESIRVERDALATQLEQALSSQFTMQVNIERLYTECEAGNEDVEQHAALVKLQRSEIDSLCAEEAHHADRAEQREVEVSTLQAQLAAAHSECSDSSTFMLQATSEFAAMRSQLVSLHTKQLDCEDRARSATSEVMSLCREVENACADNSALALQAEESALKICALRSELDEARVHNAMDLDKIARAAPSQHADHRNLMENVVRDLYEQVDQMESASAEGVSEYPLNVTSQGTQTSSGYISLQAELSRSLEECQHYRALAESVEAQRSMLPVVTTATQDKTACHHSQLDSSTPQGRMHEQPEECGAIHRLHQELEHCTGDFNLGRAETSHLLAEFHRLRADFAGEAAVQTMLRLQDAEARRESDAAILAEVNASVEQAQCLQAELGRCKAEMAEHRQSAEKLRGARRDAVSEQHRESLVVIPEVTA